MKRCMRVSTTSKNTVNITKDSTDSTESLFFHALYTRFVLRREALIIHGLVTDSVLSVWECANISTSNDVRYKIASYYSMLLFFVNELDADWAVIGPHDVGMDVCGFDLVFE